MIYTLTFNTSLDYVAYTDSVEEGKIHKISDYTLYPGGKGINVSQVLYSLGIDSEAWGFVAGITGDTLEALLNDKSIKHRFVHVAEGITRINVKLRSKRTVGVSETDFNGVGPVISKQEIDELIGMIGNITENDIVVISGSIPSSVTEPVFENILGEITKKNAKIVADITGNYLRTALRFKPFLIKPNEDETKEFLNRNIENASDVKECAEAFKDMGAQNVLISLGEKGAYLSTDDGRDISMLPPIGEVVNTVGAGDSMVAGFVAGFVQGKTYEECLKLAVCAGSATAFSKGLATGEDIKGLFDGI